jgi:hypothetical protein
MKQDSVSGSQIQLAAVEAGEGDGCLSYRPSLFYLRQELHHAQSIEHAVETGLWVCREYERLREWCRQRGAIPPKWEVHPAEARAKLWRKAG